MSAPTVTVRDAVACLHFNDPVLAIANLRDFADRIDELGRSRPVPALVIASQHPKIFLAGAHLAEIAALDEAQSRTYGRFGRSVLARIAAYPAPTVAVVNGACRGGGLDLVLTCDAIVVGPRASLAHPGVARGLVTAWGGTSSLPKAISRNAARRALIEGSEIPATTLAAAGFITGATSEDLLDLGITEAQRLSHLNPQRISIWRLLKRGDFIDRFRTSVVLNE